MARRRFPSRRVVLAFVGGLLLGVLLYLCVALRPATRAVNGPAYYPVARDLLKSARRHIRLLMFELFEARPGDRLDTLYSLLEQAARRGVVVQVLTEGGEEHLRGRVGPRNRRVLERLKRAGVAVRVDREGRTTHAKMLLVDDRWLLLGSSNWSYHALTHNLETNVLIRNGLAVHQQAAFFDSLWQQGLPVVEQETTGAQASRQPAPDTSSLIARILARPEAYHEKHLALIGRVRNLRQKFSRRGNPYTLFRLDDGQASLKVYLRGHPPIQEGQWVRVEGVFYAVKQVGRLKFYNELTAQRIEPVEEP